MPFLLLALVIIGIVLGPSLWVKRVLASNSKAREDLPGTGGELAAHLMEKFNLTGVTLETTELGDHYDTDAKAIRLSADVMNGKSLTAVATAAHEFGHALQDSTNYAALTTRTLLGKNAIAIQRFAAGAIFFIPVLALIPGLGLAARALLIFVIASMFITTVIHLVTLPVEFDASFGRALPILKQGNYVSERDLTTVRKILLACALTYVSQALVSALNIGRWMALLRR